jgi:hypothetical protein
MDGRWRAVSRDSKRDLKVLLHRTAAIEDVRRGVDTGSDDVIDLSPYVTMGSQTAFDTSLTLKFNRELFGDQQPATNQILEIQFFQDDWWMPIWIGIVDSINSFTLQRGERSMQLIAKTREQQDIWKRVKRVTPLFPIMTNLSYMAQRIARAVGLKGDEIAIPPSAFMTAHTNTQLADMNAWDMLEQIFLPMGWTPFIDCVGRLRAANRDLQGRRPDILLEDDRLVKVGGQRQRPPVSRVKVMWLNPELKMYKKMDQCLGSPVTITLGWFIPYWKRTVWYSEDHTLRAVPESTRINWETSSSVNEFAKKWLKFDFVEEKWIAQAENKGKLSFRNYQAIVAGTAFALMIAKIGARSDNVAGLITAPPPTGVTAVPSPPGTVLRTVPAATGSILEAVLTGVWATMAMTIGTGTYEIWGTPFDWVHARNTSEAFDSSVPLWVDNPKEIESDFVVNEEHAKALAIRELIYEARSVNKWSVTLVDDPRIEYGDILQFVDGNQLFVEDFSRSVERGSEATLDVKGFLIPPFAGAAVSETVELSPPEYDYGGTPIPIPPGSTGGTPPPSGGGSTGGVGAATPGGGTPTIPFPDYSGVVSGYFSAHPDEVANSCQDAGGNWDLMEGLVAALQAASGGRAGYNGKRGGSERSKDAISIYYGAGTPTEGSHDVYIVDVIGGHCGANPVPAWNNVSAPAPGAWYSSH